MTNYEPPLVPQPSQPARRLTRSSDRIIAGVCAGVADYFGLNVTAVRAVVVLAVLLGFGTGILLYLAGWLLIPGPDGRMAWQPR